MRYHALLVFALTIVLLLINARAIAPQDLSNFQGLYQCEAGMFVT